MWETTALTQAREAGGSGQAVAVQATRKDRHLGIF